jgi:MazG family protein
VPYLLEEADETADAILREDASALRDELGDLLLNLAFQIVLAEEEGTFGPAEVVARLEEKMRIRHPHVYGDAEEPPDWEETKRLDDDPAGGTERDDGHGPRTTAIGDAERTQARAARVGFDWPEAAGALEKLREEADELAELLSAGHAPPREEAPEDEARAALREEVGDLLFAAISVARLADVDAETALREATGKFRTRFRRLLRLAERRGADPMEADLESLEALWREVKEG